MEEIIKQIIDLGFNRLPHSYKHYFILDKEPTVIQIEEDSFTIECLITGHSYVGKGNITIDWIQKELKNLNKFL